MTISMKKRAVAIVASLAMVLSLGLLAGCSNENEKTVDEGGEVSLKAALQNSEGMWFETSCKEGLDKESEINEAYMFKEGKVVRYGLDDMTLGDVTKLSDEEIIEKSKENWKEEIENANPFEENGHVSHEDEAWSGVDESNEPILKDAYTSFKFDEKQAFKPQEYYLNVITDGSGNNTETEILTFRYQSFEGDFKYEDDDSFFFGERLVGAKYYISDENKETYDFIYGGYMGQIYETDFGGFVYDDGDRCLITKCNPETMFVLDTPGTDGVSVDESY